MKDFWGDLCRLENKKNHYVGVLTLEPAKEEDYKKWIDDLWIIDAKRYIPFYVVVYNLDICYLSNYAREKHRKAKLYHI